MKTFQKLFGRLFYKPEKLLCGTFNTMTGESTHGYRMFNGDIVYKKDKTYPIWSDKEYLGLVTRSYDHIHRITGANRKTETQQPFYREFNKYTNKYQYFVEYGGDRHDVHTEAYERDNKIIFV